MHGSCCIEIKGPYGLFAIYYMLRDMNLALANNAPTVVRRTLRRVVHGGRAPATLGRNGTAAHWQDSDLRAIKSRVRRTTCPAPCKK